MPSRPLVKRAVVTGELRADTDVAGPAAFDGFLVGMSMQARDGMKSAPA